MKVLQTGTHSALFSYCGRHQGEPSQTQRNDQQCFTIRLVNLQIEQNVFRKMDQPRSGREALCNRTIWSFHWNCLNFLYKPTEAHTHTHTLYFENSFIVNSALSNLLRQHTDCDTAAPGVSELFTVSLIEKSNNQTPFWQRFSPTHWWKFLIKTLH